MAVTAEDVLIRFVGEDRVTPVMRGINQQLSTMGSSGASSVGAVTGQVSGLESAVGSLTDMLGTAGAIMTSVFGVQGIQQLYDMTVGVAALKQGYTYLLSGMMGSKEAASELMEYTKEFSYNTPFMFRDFAYGLTLVKSSSEATGDQMKKMLPDMTNMALLYQLKGLDPKQGMLAYSQGLIGNFRSMTMQAGITQDKLKEFGYSGVAGDIDSYTKAMNGYFKSIGLNAANMDTYTVSLEKFKSTFRSAMAGVGDMMLPVLTRILEFGTAVMQAIPKPVKMAGVVIVGLVFALMALVPWLGMAWPLLAHFGIVSAGAATATAGATVSSETFALSIAQLETTMALYPGVAVPFATSTEAIAAAETQATVASGGLRGGLTRLKASLISLQSTIIPLLIIVAALIIAWKAFEWWTGENKKTIEKNKKAIAELQPDLRKTKQRYEELQTLLINGQTQVYDPEKKKWVDIKTAVNEAGAEYFKTKNEIRKAHEEIVRTKASESSAGKSVVAGLMGPMGMVVGAPGVPRESRLGKTAELGTGILGNLFGGERISQVDSERAEVVGLRLDYERLHDTEKDYEATKRKGETREAWRTRQRKITNTFLEEEYGLHVAQIQAYRDADIEAGKFDTAVSSLSKSLNSLMWALISVFYAFTGKDQSATDAIKNSKDPTDDLSESVGVLTDFITEITPFIVQLGIAVSQVAEFFSTLARMIRETKGAIDEMGADVWGFITGGGTALPTIGTSINVTKGEAKGGVTPTGLATTAQKTTGLEALRGDVTYQKKSPLTMVPSSGMGPSLLRFPQLTPEFLQGVENMRSGAPGGRRRGGENHVHTHTHNVTIDARHMSEEQLMGMFIKISERKVRKDKANVVRTEAV